MQSTQRTRARAQNEVRMFFANASRRVKELGKRGPQSRLQFDRALSFARASFQIALDAVSYTHLRAHETSAHL
eukprot:1507274-Alexandrium_andersonii.AAC.1